MFFLCGCACISFSDLLAYGYVVMMLNVIRFDITIKKLNTYKVIQVITDKVVNCKAAGAIIEDKYPNIFWSGCLVHTLNLLMHGIVKMKDPSYQWIGALYKRCKKMIKFITNHSMAHHIFAITLGWSY